jgi:hypothetical protein
MTAVNPMTTAAANRRTESIVRRLRRPGSVSARKAIPQDRSAAALTRGPSLCQTATPE